MAGFFSAVLNTKKAFAKRKPFLCSKLLMREGKAGERKFGVSPAPGHSCWGSGVATGIFSGVGVGVGSGVGVGIGPAI